MCQSRLKIEIVPQSGPVDPCTPALATFIFFPDNDQQRSDKAEQSLKEQIESTGKLSPLLV